MQIPHINDQRFPRIFSAVTPYNHDSRYDLLRSMLIAARKSRNLTQTDLAARLKKTQAWVSRSESGGRQIDVIEFVDITAALGIDPGRVLRKIAR